eukprot:GFUD01135805.1.p1 GENE.GFUD01135805.1~~GFUD01135805.1.p1  ORF type:complete len:228 (+),score=76.61 GFUD01135805.1:304-987(+)
MKAMVTKIELESLVDILMTTKSEKPEMHHTRTTGTPFFWHEAIGDKNKGPLTDEDIDVIAEAKKKDFASAHEIFPNLFLGNKAAAEDTNYMKSKGITHLLNMGSVSLRSPKFLVVPHKEELASEGIELENSPDWGEMKLSDCFDHCGKWIDQALDNGGQVLVVCWQGASRSATVVMAYLVRYKEMGLEAVLTMVKEKRDIRPNNFFLQQLIDYYEGSNEEKCNLEVL